MKQKCPKCGRWCDGEHMSFIKRADKEFDKTANTFGEYGAALGSLFGKRGENFGRKAGAFLSGATNIATVKAAFGGLTGNEYSFQCPKCGYSWEATDESEDQIDSAREDYQSLISSITEALGGDDYDTAITLSQEVTELHFGEGMYWLARSKRYKAESLLNGEIPEDEQEQRRNNHDALIESAIKDIEACEQYYLNEEDDPDDLAWAITEKGWLYTEKSNSIARRWFMVAMQSGTDSIRENATEGYRYATNRVLSIVNDFLNVDSGLAEISDSEYDSPEEKAEFEAMVRQEAENSKFCNMEAFPDRQFIFIVRSEEKIAGCYDMDDNINWAFTQDQLPADIYFPTGHPMPNTLYVAHPAKKGYYLPYEGAEDAMFHDKVEDFCRLAQCLGAVEISFNSLQGKSVSQTVASSMDVSANGGRKKLNASGSYSESGNASSDVTTSKEVGLSYTYKPTRAPYCPDDIEWLDADPSWKTFVKQRLEGNILTYTKRISSSETTNMSSNKRRGVKASFETLMKNVDGNYDSSIDTTFNSSENTVWEITVRFKSLDEYETDSNPINQPADALALTEAEERYKEEVMFILEDGDITDSERRLLERKRQKFGVSEDRARLIWESCTPSLSDDEKEYIEIFKELVSDGDITERKRKMLKREADSLCISDERAQELEKLA